MSAHTDHADELLHAFHIDAADLAANRSGILGSRQAQLLRRSAAGALAGAAAAGLGLAAILWLVADKPLAPVQWIVSGLLFAAIATVGIVYAGRLRAAVRAGRVDCISGIVRVRRRGRAGWFLDVDDRSFRLPVRFWHLPVEAPYRVYVAPRPNRVVAMEPDGWS
jgi:hypothetical protein